MKRRTIPVRTFLAASAVGLLLFTTAAMGTAWKLDRSNQTTDRQRQLSAAASYVRTYTTHLANDAPPRILAAHLAALQVDAEITVDAPGQVRQLLYTSPDLLADAPPAVTRERAAQPRAAYTFPIDATHPQTLVTLQEWARPLDGSRSVLAAATAGLTVLLLALTLVVLLTTRWVVAPLRRLSRDVDAIAGGEPPHGASASRLREITNITTALTGMAEALRITAEHDSRTDAQRRFLVSATAHDLRTPLFILRGHLDAIATGIGAADQHLDKARAKATQLDRLIADLFTHARAELGEPPHLTTVDLLDAVHQAADEYPRIRIAGQPIPVIIDSDRFQRVLTNLLDNAVRHSPPDATIDITVGRDDTAATVHIADHGPGIPNDLLPHLFEPIMRDDRPHPRGTGLGLTIAAHLLQTQNGTIHAANQDRGGALFTIRLPLPDTVSA
jgi:signal transduction histidine kinase